jgi:hypothetical protein
MTKAALLLAVALAGCSHEDTEQTRKDARKLGQDLKEDAKKADAEVTKELKDAREKVKKEVDKPPKEDKK